MAIKGYSGLTGSGKSYSVVSNVILPALEKGRTVVTNIPMNIKNEKLISFDIHHLVDNREEIETFAPKGSVIVIDEAQHMWPSGLKGNQIPKAEKDFFTEHRHKVGEDGFSNEIILISQDLGNIAAFVRNLISETFVTTKLEAIGQKNRYRVDIYQGAVTGQRPPKQLLKRQLYGKYEPEVYKHYKSQTQSEIDEIGSETPLDERGNILSSPLLKYGMIAAVIMILFGLYKVGSFFNPEDSELINSTDQIAQNEQPKPLKRMQPLPTPDPEPLPEPKPVITNKPAYHPDWRLAGVIERNPQDGLAIIVSDQGQRTLDLTECYSDFAGEYFCNYENKLVTDFSGRKIRLGESTAKNQMAGF
jgi:zona occludens toxin